MQKLEKVLNERTYLPWLVFMLGLLALYGGTLSFGLTYDDFLLVRQYSSDELVSKFYTPWSERFYRPIVNLVFAAEFLLFGSCTWAYHLVNLIIAATTLYLFYRIMVRLFQTPMIALCSGLLWMILPGNAVICSWISTRTDSICLVFYLLAIFTFLQAISVQKLKLCAFLISLVAAALAYLSKESAVTLPLLMAAVAWTLRPAKQRFPVRLLVPHFVLLAVYFMLRWWILGAKVIGEKGLSQHAAIAQQPLAGLAGLLARYFEAVISCFYPIFLMPGLMSAVLILFSLGMFFYLSCRSKKLPSHRHLIFYWILITALPNIFDASPRLLWLPTLGSAYLLVMLFFAIRQQVNPLRLSLLAGVFLLAMLEINGMVQNCFTKTVYQETLKYDIQDRRRWPFSDLKNIRYQIRERVIEWLDRNPDPLQKK